jgi:RHS repeat-associated protein
MGNRPLLRRGLCASLALTFLVPPNLLFAQDAPPVKNPQPNANPAKLEGTLDLRGIDQLDVNPNTGDLICRRTDLVVGEGSQAFKIVRTYRPSEGDLFNMGHAWVSPLDQHLDVHPSGNLASFVNETGQRILFRVTKAGTLVATVGARAVVEVKENGYLLSGLGDERTYRFDSQGWLLSRTGPNQTLTYRYDAKDRLQAVDGPWGRLRLRRNTVGVLKAIVAPDGRAVRYERDDRGNLSRVLHEGSFETFRYDPVGQLTSLADGKALISYDATGRVVRLGGTGLHAQTFRYLSGDGEWSQQVQITKGERTSTVSISTDGRTISRTGADGLTSTTTLDDRDRPVRFVAADGRAWRRSYDAKGRLKTSTSPMGVTHFEYQAKVTDRPTRVTLPDGRTLETTYDLRGKVIRFTSSDGATINYAYDAHGRLATKTDRRGAKTVYTRDAQGRVLKVAEDGLGETSYLRDAQGRLLKIRQPNGKIMSIARSADGRTIRTADGRGPSTSKTFDPRGRLVSYDDAFGRSYNYSYTPQGELKNVSDTLGELIAFDYDPSGQLTDVTDALGNTTTIKRDGLKLTISDPGQGERVLKRDSKTGRLIEETRGGKTTKYTYDSRGQITQRETPQGVETFKYDAQGRLLGMSGTDGEMKLAFDENGRLAKVQNPAIGKSVEYSYSKSGDRTALRMPWGTVKYDYDVQGRVRAIKLPEGGTIEIDQHPDGRRKEIRYPNGVVTRFSYKHTRLQSVVTKKHDKVLEQRSYGYDKNGRVAWTEGLSGERTHYVHDARGRLTRVQSKAETVTYSYDAMGNRTQETRGGKTITTQIGAGNRVVNRLAPGTKTQTFTYSAQGAMTSATNAEGTTHYTYDCDDQLTKAVKPDGEVVKYGYAPNGTRLWREDGKGKTHFLHDLADVVGEFTESGKLKTSFVHGSGADDVLSASHDGEQYFYHYDLVRSVTAMTGQQGTVEARYDYDAFGQQKQAEGNAVAWNPYRYTSRSFDASTDQYHYRARSYDPMLGRFTSADPAGLRGGLNLYSYAANDPTLFNDPFGFWPDWLDSVGSAIGSAVDTVGSALDTGITTVGGWVDTGVTAAGGWVADNVLPDSIRDEVAYLGRQSWAFTRGFGKGIYGGVKGVVTLVRHPIDTVKGIAHAIENWDETKEALVQVWDTYMDAMENDPEKFAEMTGQAVGELVFAVAGTKGLDKLAKASSLAKLGNGVSRVARVTAPVVRPIANVARAGGAAVATKFPKLAAVVVTSTEVVAKTATATANAVKNGANALKNSRFLHNGRVLNRARRLELLRRAAAPGPWYRAIPRRIANVGRDLWSGARLAATRPGAFVVYTGARLTAMGGSLVASTGRGLWTATKFAGIPVMIAFEDNITDAIKRSKTREEAMGEVTSTGRKLLKDAASLSPEELAMQIREVGDAYVNFRNRLLKPVHDEDMHLDALMTELDSKVASGEIPPETIDARLDAMLKDYGRRRHNLMVELYDRNRDEEHDMLHPSMNRTISFQDEIDLIEAVMAKVTNPEGKILAQARIDDLKALMEYEYNLFRAGDHDLLIAGIAGVPRALDAEPTGAAGYDGLGDDFEGTEWDPSTGPVNAHEGR